MASLDAAQTEPPGVSKLSLSEEQSESRTTGTTPSGSLPTTTPESRSAEDAQAEAPTTNVAALLEKDAEDESLRRYKESLMAAAVKGDLGDTSDPRRVVIAEFRIVFEDAAVEDIVADLSTPQGVDAFKAAGVKLREGCSYKFRIAFKVQHEIVDALTYRVSLTKMGLGESDEVVLGSYAPQTEPHTFEHPRYGWEEAPKGMLYRGKYTARCKFTDGLKNTHVEFSYPVTITK